MSNPQNILMYINFQIIPEVLKGYFLIFYDLLSSHTYLVSNHPLSPDWLIYGSHWKSECWHILQIKLFRSNLPGQNAFIPFTTVNGTSMHTLKADSTHNELLRGKCNPPHENYTWRLLCFSVSASFKNSDLSLFHNDSWHWILWQFTFKHTSELYKTDFCNAL